MPASFPPRIESGTLSLVGSGQIENILSAIEHSILSMTGAQTGTPVWRIYEDLTSGGVYDKVFFSSGSVSATGLGDAKIFVRARRSGTTTIIVNSYADWSIVNHNGTGGSANQQFTTYNDSSSVEFYTVVNEYAFATVLSQSTDWTGLYGGELIRDVLTTQRTTGRAFLNAAITTTGSNIVVNLDRDLSNNIIPGQNATITTQTPSGSTLKGLNCSISRVISVSATGVMMATVAFTHSIGDIFGIYPVNNVCKLGTAGIISSIGAGLQANGTGTAFVFANEVRDPAATSESLTDPNAIGQFFGMSIGFYNTAQSVGKAGTAHHWIAVSDDGNWTINDRIRLNFNNNKVFKVFPNLSDNPWTVALPDTGTVDWS